MCGNPVKIKSYAYSVVLHDHDLLYPCVLCCLTKVCTKLYLSINGITCSKSKHIMPGFPLKMDKKLHKSAPHDCC